MNLSSIISLFYNKLSIFSGDPKYTLSKESNVALMVLNIKGQVIETLINNNKQDAGSYSIHWNGKTNTNLNAPSSTYILYLKTNGTFKTQKILLLR